eukprot:TRINITY_DN95_c0_g4_i1.p1 TRINITY_DN95_c0_g4~~TRINITY_DN95_c0_g4_i1.p1  ORF type:complete len:990 (+),score=139.82 TRINITY_DN95_c0_g4_i1:2-2971(+)
MKRQIHQDLYMKLFQEIEFEEFNKYDTIFEFGDKGDKFYIILDGEVFVLIPKNQLTGERLLQQKANLQSLKVINEDESRKQLFHQQMIIKNDLTQLKELLEEKLLVNYESQKQMKTEDVISKIKQKLESQDNAYQLNLEQGQLQYQQQQQQLYNSPKKNSSNTKSEKSFHFFTPMNTQYNGSNYNNSGSPRITVYSPDSKGHIRRSSIQLSQDDTPAQSHRSLHTPNSTTSPQRSNMRKSMPQTQHLIPNFQSPLSSHSSVLLSMPQSSTSKNSTYESKSYSQLKSSTPNTPKQSPIRSAKKVENTIYVPKNQYFHRKSMLEDVDYQSTKRMFPQFIIIKQLQEGEGFGELALRSNKFRQATCICKTACKMAVISKENFKNILDNQLNQDLQEKMNFIMSIPQFKKASLRQLSAIIPLMKKRSYQMGEIIYREGDEAKCIYFVHIGVVEISKQIPIHKGMVKQKYIFEDRDKNKCVLDRDKLLQQDFYQQMKKVILTTKSTSEWFGEVEVINQTARFTKAVSVTPKVEIFRINKNKFFLNLQSQYIMQLFFDSANVLEQWHSQTFDYKACQKQKIEELHQAKSKQRDIKEVLTEKYKSDFFQKQDKILDQKDYNRQFQLATFVYYNSLKQTLMKNLNLTKSISYSKLGNDAFKQIKGASQNLVQINNVKADSLKKIVSAKSKNQKPKLMKDAQIESKQKSPLQSPPSTATYKILKQQTSINLDCEQLKKNMSLHQPNSPAQQILHHAKSQSQYSSTAFNSLQPTRLQSQASINFEGLDCQSQQLQSQQQQTVQRETDIANMFNEVSKLHKLKPQKKPSTNAQLKINCEVIKRTMIMYQKSKHQPPPLLDTNLYNREHFNENTKADMKKKQLYQMLSLQNVIPKIQVSPKNVPINSNHQGVSMLPQFASQFSMKNKLVYQKQKTDEQNLSLPSLFQKKSINFSFQGDNYYNLVGANKKVNQTNLNSPNNQNDNQNPIGKKEFSFSVANKQ